MNDVSDHVEPTLDDLFEASAPWRVEGEAFERGIAERIEDGEAGATVDAVLDDGPEGTRALLASRPAWIRRAAAIAPAASLKVLGVAKGAPGAKAGATAAGSAWLAPIAAIGLAAAGVFAATARLDGDRGDAEVDPRSTRLGSGWGWIAALAFVGVLLASFFLGLAVASPVFAAFQVAATVAVVRVLSALGRASRATLAATLSALFVQVALVVAWGVPDRPSTGSLVAALLLLCAAVVLFAVARGTGWSGVQAAVRSPGAGLVAVWFAVVAIVLVPRPFGTTQRAVVLWANGVAAPVDDLSTWENLGRLSLALAPDELARVDRERLAAVVSGADDLHPVVSRAALRLGVLPPDLAGRHVGASWAHRPRFSSTRYVFAGNELVHVADARARGILDGELLDELRAMLAASWPAAGDPQSLERAVGTLEIADAAGLEGFVAEAIGDVPAVLEAAWIGRRAPASGGAGFEPLFRGDDGDLPLARFAASTDQAFAASVLVARLARERPAAIESLDVDLDSFQVYLDRERRRPLPVGKPHPYRVEAALARHVLLGAVDVPPPSTVTWLLRNAVLVAALVSVAIAAAAVVRARPAPAVWDGPGPEGDGPGPRM